MSYLVPVMVLYYCKLSTTGEQKALILPLTTIYGGTHENQ
jgi:hypothetical protein